MDANLESEEAFKPVYPGDDGTSILEQDLHLSETDESVAAHQVQGWKTDQLGQFTCMVEAC